MPENQFVPDEATLETLSRLPDDGPVVMLNLLRFKPDGGFEEYMKYGAIAGPQVLKRGGAILYNAPSLGFRGQTPDWDRVIVVRYPSRATFIDMMRDREYQKGLGHRAAGLEDTILYALKPGVALLPGATVPPPEPVKLSGGDEVFIVNLLRFKGEQGKEDYLRYGRVVGPIIRDLGGGPVLEGDGELPVVGSETWDHFVLVRYSAIEKLQGMVQSSEWQAANEHRQRGLDATVAFPTQPDPS